jgi:hypothetical protein
MWMSCATLETFAQYSSPTVPPLEYPLAGSSCEVVYRSILWSYTILTISLTLHVLQLRFSGCILAPDDSSGCNGLISLLVYYD